MIRRTGPNAMIHILTLVLIALALLPGRQVWAQSSAPTPTLSGSTPLSLESTRQAYELLLDRFVMPVEPAALLGVAWSAAVPHLQEAGARVDLSMPTFPGNRFEAWREFSRRIQDAWDSSNGGDAVTLLVFPMNEAMAASMHEGHTAFRTPTEYQDYLSWQRNDEKYEGIGVSFRGKNYVILEVFPGSPAEIAGLKSGDQILAADGVNLEGTDLEEGRRRIRGPSGTQVELLIRRASVAAPLTLTVPRQEIKIEPVRWRMMDNNIGYIRIVGFPHPIVATQVEQALAEFDQHDVRGIILDLRGNGGGRLDVGMRVASKFIAEGTLFEQVSRDRRERSVGTVGGYWDHTAPIAVLTDGGTASMGEILAAALRDNDAATIFGAKTAGIVSAAQVFPLVDGSGMQVTILEIRGAKGEQMNDVGVVPDVIVEYGPNEIEAGRDTQLESAANWVQSQPSFLAPTNAAH